MNVEPYTNGRLITNYALTENEMTNLDTSSRKLHIAVLFGGRSVEHEISLMSARSVLSVLDPTRYQVTQIGITHDGKWLTGEDVLGKFEQNKSDGLEHFILSPDPSDDSHNTPHAIDIYFPVLHGT